MAGSNLSSGVGSPSGTLTGNAKSLTFGNPLNNTFEVRLGFSQDAVGSVTVTRSTDGVNFYPTKMGGRVTSARSSQGSLWFWPPTAQLNPPTPDGMYRLEASLSAGSASYIVLSGGAPIHLEGSIGGSTFVPSKSGTLTNGTATAGVDQSTGIVIRADVSSPDAMIGIDRSTDGGATWSSYLARSNASFNLLVMPQGTPPGIYRYNWSISTGSIAWYTSPVQEGEAIAFQGYDFSGASAIEQQHQAQLWTPLADADLAGDLIFYKYCAPSTQGGLFNFAKVRAPAAAKRRKAANEFILGDHRSIRVEYVNVLAVFDASGNAISQAASLSDSSTVYSAGSLITSRDLRGFDLGDFTQHFNRSGIYGYPTLVEAASRAGLDYPAMAALAAKGL